MLSLCLLFEGDLVIVGEGIVVGAFVVITVNTMMMAHVGVMVSALVVDARRCEWDGPK
jgi:hypothetical protein